MFQGVFDAFLNYLESSRSVPCFETPSSLPAARFVFKSGVQFRGNARILDLACGHLQDCTKYQGRSCGFVLGVDLSPDSIIEVPPAGLGPTRLGCSE